jgi:pimeloyl-ACP methyl ester carboxylesterase
MKTYEECAEAIGAQPRMVGVVTRPVGERCRRSVAVILLGAGLVHHVGPNRLMVRLARRLAARGLASVRFDHRGIGDSEARSDGQAFEVSAIEEAREVMDHLAAKEDVDAFVLLGICSGAETALGTALQDARVVGVGMINGGGQGAGAAWDTHEYARTQVRHYLTNAIFNADSWRRALTGRIQYRRLANALVLRVRNAIAPPAQVAVIARETAGQIEGLAARGVRLLWVHSERDFSRDYFDTMFGNGAGDLLDSGRMRVEVIRYVDHTLTARHGQDRFFDIVEGWLDAFVQADAAAPEAVSPAMVH